MSAFPGVQSRRVTFRVPADDQVVQEFLDSQMSPALSLRALIWQFAQAHGAGRDVIAAALGSLGIPPGAACSDGVRAEGGQGPGHPAGKGAQRSSTAGPGGSPGPDDDDPPSEAPDGVGPTAEPTAAPVLSPAPPLLSPLSTKKAARLAGAGAGPGRQAGGTPQPDLPPPPPGSTQYDMDDIFALVPPDSAARDQVSRV